MKNYILALLASSLSILSLNAQVLDPVKWKFSAEKSSGNQYTLIFEAAIEGGWHMYGLNIPEGGPVATSFVFTETPGVDFLTEIKPSQAPEVKYDNTFEMDLELFGDAVRFTRKVRVNESGALEGYVEYMVCDDSRCLPPKEVEFSFNLEGPSAVERADDAAEEIPVESGIPENAPAQKNTFEKTPAGISPVEQASAAEAGLSAAPDSAIVASTDPGIGNDEEDDSLLSLFFLALIAGFAALITPCVYPIIPLTVSFFMREGSRSKAIYNGLVFGLSIIFIYTLVGLIAGLFRVNLVDMVRTHWLPNLIFLAIFIALAISFFGVYEITLPSSLSTRIDKRADKGGFLGPFFMALATAVISFSCTGIIVGIALGSAMQGDLVKPIVGMFGFSVSFALPFTLLAIFPGFIKSMPKSGGWLNSVKVVIAFILLISSLMFAGNLGMGRTFVLSVAIVLFILLGFYLLGKLMFSHDSPVERISVMRTFLAVLSFSVAVYLIPGLFGAPLKSISAFLPAKDENSIDLTRLGGSPAASANVAENSPTFCTDKPKYADILHLPHGLKGYFDYDEALACAEELNKPVLLDFAGHNCKNCKKMYAEVWSDPRVLNMLRNDFVVAALYTDDRTELPESEWITSRLDGKVKKTIGKKFNDLQIEKFGSNALPLYAIVDSEGNILTQPNYYTYSPDIEGFINFLNQGKMNFGK